MEFPALPYLQRVKFRNTPPGMPHPATADAGAGPAAAATEGPDAPEHPWDIPAVRRLDRMEFHPAVTFFAGENGSGKSTVLEALAVMLGFSPEGGTRNVRFQTTPCVSLLHRYLQPVRSWARFKSGYFLRAESLFNVATWMDTEAGGFDPSMHRMSHGEAFLWLLSHKFRPAGLYLLDEPECALSSTRQLAALARIHHLVRQRCQFIIATHSPILLAYPHARIYTFDQDGFHETPWERTEACAVTRSFLNNPAQHLKELLAEEPQDGAGG